VHCFKLLFWALSKIIKPPYYGNWFCFRLQINKMRKKFCPVGTFSGSTLKRCVGKKIEDENFKMRWIFAVFHFNGRVNKHSAVVWLTGSPPTTHERDKWRSPKGTTR
jgi:hypothetical protein